MTPLDNRHLGVEWGVRGPGDVVARCTDLHDALRREDYARTIGGVAVVCWRLDGEKTWHVLGASNGSRPAPAPPRRPRRVEWWDRLGRGRAVGLLAWLARNRSPFKRRRL